jgi:acyl-CoA synthetase (AMP-forming)/AMP-acid ligase II
MTYTDSAVLDHRRTTAGRPETLVSLLRRRAASAPDALLYEVLEDGDDRALSLTAAELDNHARHVGAILQGLGAQGARAVVLYSPGIEFVNAFFGCLYAGAVAVPAPPPESEEALTRLEALIRDAGARIVLTSSALRAPLASRLAGQDVSVIAPFAAADDCADDWTHPILDGSSLAYLQYTSGPAATQRGVMLSHGNLLHNSELMRRALDVTPEDRMVNWLAPYHELGLIGGILQPLYAGCASVLMTPAHFLERPFRWLRAISRYRATISGGPNFAYDLCVRRTTPAQRAELDLSSWRVALNGTEPVQPRTLAEFSQSFAPHGFDPIGFYPFYAVAEASLMVSGGGRPTAPVIGVFDREELEAGVARIVTARTGHLLASCGQPRPGQLVRIVNPETGFALGAGEVGEIWVGGPSVSPGFWRRRAETMDAFGAFVRDTGDGPFLRTGDLGFLLAGELFVTGKIQNRITVGGHGYLPQEIEEAAGASHEVLSPGGGAAFSIRIDGEETIVILHEVNDPIDAFIPEEVALVVRAAVTRKLGLAVRDVVLLRPGGLPRSAIGKVQRSNCRQRYLEGTLDALS